MGQYLVPAAMVCAMLAFATAALAAGVTPYRPDWWRAAVALAVLGGITPKIYAVNVRIVPVFSRRPWPSEAWPRLQMGLAILSAWAVFAGRIAGWKEIVIASSALALGGGIVFMANVARLFRQPATLPAPPLPDPGQAAVDAIATRFTRLAGIYLVLGLTVGLATEVWTPVAGRWDLVWAHTMLVGFFLSMASGVCYHVLARWTGRPWKALAPIRLHFMTVALGLPLMLLALATDRDALFAVAGPLQAAAIGLLLANCVPMIGELPDPTRPAFAGAITLLGVGITLGALFAFDPALGARLRLAHAELNLFGWTGLVISGVGCYLVPRFAGKPLRWPRLATVQLAALGAGVTLGTAGLVWRAYGEGPAWLVPVAHGLVAAGFLLFGALLAGSFHQASFGVTAPLPMVQRPARHRPSGAAMTEVRGES